MVGTESKLIGLKVAIALSKLLHDAKGKGTAYARITDKKIEHNNSLGKISVDTGITKSGLSQIFNGKTHPKIGTVMLILQSLNKSLADLSKVIDKITDSDIQKFKEQSTTKKSAPAKKKTKK
ncbi:helix-turn-helix transcriptional regulator [Sediminibacterium roseum]|uniref:Helix-turn-helix transcriptional regulator n=1 Tax=Sediminibacterium roseum TaxID=1978412 RepID=A0ABX0A074_9BACT|nr:helix-turn-helix transcriptional regulator [Sediminibacterium roseum]NCI51327.1 helix-turn-helix transcriptional regulator [Sediminibacterium roseum]